MNPTCPRCGGPLGDRPPAGSRASTDRTIAICEPCGTDEAILQFFGVVIEPEQWPVAVEAITARRARWLIR